MERIRRLCKIVPFTFLIMLTMVAVLILFIAIISAISYFETAKNLENNWKDTINNTGDHLIDSLELVSNGLRLFELTYDTDLKAEFIPFLEAYNRSNQNPLVIDLEKIKTDYSSSSSTRTDLYIIDDQGVIINTTYRPDLGLDFKQWPDVYKDLTKIRKGDTFQSDRAVVGFNSNQTIRKYSYLPTPDHRYLLELSVIVEDYIAERKDFSLVHAAASVAEKNQDIISIILYDSMFRPLQGEETDSSITNNETIEIIKSIFSTKSDIETQGPNGIVTDRYMYIPLGSDKTVSDNMLDLVAHIKYNSSFYQKSQKLTLQYHLLIALVSGFIAILLAYFLTRYIARPIRQIINDIDCIAKGEIDHPIHRTGNPDFSRLEKSITIMVQSLKNLIGTLKEKETRLVVSEEEFRSLVESQIDIIVRYNPSGTIRYVNPTFCQIFHLTKKEVMDRSVFDLVSGGLLNGIQDYYNRMSVNPSPNTIENRIELKDGTIIWIQWSNSVIYNQQHQIVEFQSVGRDITEQKRAEIALRESEEKYRLLISKLPDIVVVHVNGIILLTNDATVKVLGYDQKTLIGSNIFDYIPFEYRSKVTSNLQERMLGFDIPDYEIAIKASNNSLRQVVVRGSIISYGGTPAFLTVLTDITEWKRAKDEIIQGERRYERLVGQLNEGILITDTNAITLFTNTRMQEILGYSELELVGKKFSMFISPSEMHNLTEKLMHRMKGISERYTLTLLTKDNIEIYTEISASPSIGPDGKITGSVAVVTDITQRKKDEIKIEKYTRDLEQKTHELEILRDQLFIINKDLDRIVKSRTDQVMKLLRQKDDFIMQLGHDLRTPLSPIIGLLPNLIEDQNDEANKQALVIIQKNVRFIQDICDKSLKLAKMGSFDIKPDIEPVSIRDFISSLLFTRSCDLQIAGITSYNNVPSNLIAGVDPILFHELLENLISNGIKYIQRKDGEIVISGTQIGVMIEIRLADNGPGLRADETEKIFNVFYKSDCSRHDKTSTGLGLAICRRIVENHGGSIVAESPGPGAGTTFIILLPAWKQYE